MAPEISRLMLQSSLRYLIKHLVHFTNNYAENVLKLGCYVIAQKEKKMLPLKNEKINANHICLQMHIGRHARLCNWRFPKVHLDINKN